MYKALSIQFRIGLVSLLIAFLIILVLPNEGLEALGGFLALYFVFLLHLPLVPQLIYYFWKGEPRNWLIWTLTVYLTVMMSIALWMFVVVNDIDDYARDRVDAWSHPDGYELRERAWRMALDSARGVPSPADREVVASLIERVNDLDASSEHHPPVLWSLASVGDEALVAAVLERGATADGPSLYRAVEGQHAGVVKLLLKAGASPDTAMSSRSVLAVAAQAGDLETTRALIDAGADLNDGSPILWPAVLSGNAEVVDLLLAGGLDPANSRHRLIDQALEQDSPDMIAVLNRHGAGLDWGGPGDPVIFDAIRRCDVERLAWLLDQGASPDVVDRHGNSAIALALNLESSACEMDRVRAQIIDELIDHGAHLDGTTRSGRGLVAASLSDDRVEIARRLIDAGAPLMPGVGRRNVLMLAARAGARDIVDAAIGAGQSPTEWTDGGNATSGLLEAVEGGHAELVRHFFELGAQWRNDVAERNAFRHAARELEVLRVLLEHYEFRSEGYQNLYVRRAVEENGDEAAIALLEEFGL
ncbi:MAG: ankyrin repeat domain-containing protein [Wenzhouxiangella sp.]|jgi:ankyrin repeat protein|nr:ankyrin repeat domain-containing protein [Wenzhouxiangella sp.]